MKNAGRRDFVIIICQGNLAEGRDTKVAISCFILSSRLLFGVLQAYFLKESTLRK